MKEGKITPQSPDINSRPQMHQVPHRANANLIREHSWNVGTNWQNSTPSVGGNWVWLCCRERMGCSLRACSICMNQKQLSHRDSADDVCRRFERAEDGISRREAIFAPATYFEWKQRKCKENKRPSQTHINSTPNLGRRCERVKN